MPDTHPIHPPLRPPLSHTHIYIHTCQSWVHDPKLTDDAEVKASIKLRFRTQNDRRLVVIRCGWGRGACGWMDGWMDGGWGGDVCLSRRRLLCLPRPPPPHPNPKTNTQTNRSLQLQYKGKNKTPTFKQLEGVIRNINPITKKSGACARPLCLPAFFLSLAGLCLCVCVCVLATYTHTYTTTTTTTPLFTKTPPQSR